MRVAGDGTPSTRIFLVFGGFASFLDWFRIGYGVMGWGYVRIGSSNMAEYITYLRWSKSTRPARPVFGVGEEHLLHAYEGTCWMCLGTLGGG